MEMSYLLAIISLTFFLPLLQCQTPRPTFDRGNCSLITLSDLGNSETLSTSGLLPLALREREGPSPGPAPEVRVIDFHVVCEAAGQFRDTMGSVSLVVMFECRGSACAGDNDTVIVNSTEQIQLECTLEFEEGGFVGNDNYVTSPFSGVLRTTNPVASFSTVPDNRCGFCADPVSGLMTDVETHCLSCSDVCDEGQQRCIGPDSDQCCNWYLDNRCVVTCPAPFVGDLETFDCGCPALSLDNGEITYSDRFAPGSVATFTCNEGFRLDPPCTNTRSCTMDGWTGFNYTCESILPNTPAVTPAPPVPSAPDQGTLIAAVIVLSLLCILLFFLGLVLGACGHHFWMQRRFLTKEKRSYSIDKPVLPAAKIIEDDIEQAVYSDVRDGDSNKSNSSLKSGASGSIRESIALNENVAYGSRTRLFVHEVSAGQTEATTTRARAGTDMEDNPYVSDPMEQKAIREMGLGQTAAGGDAREEKLYDTITDGPPEDPDIGVGLNQNVAYRTSSRSPEHVDYYSAADVESGSGHGSNQDSIPTGGNVAYKPTTSSSTGDIEDYDTTLVDNCAYSRDAATRRDTISTNVNVAYKPTRSYNDSNIDDYDDIVLVKNSANVPAAGDISVASNIAYTTHTGRGTESNGRTYSRDPLQRERKQETVGLSSKESYTQHNIGTSVSTKAEDIPVSENAAYLTHPNGNDAVSVDDNVAYLTARGEGENSNVISVEENVAYLTHQDSETPNTNEDTSYDDVYISRNISEQAQGGEISVNTNIAYLKHQRSGDEVSTHEKPVRLPKPAVTERRKNGKITKNDSIVNTGAQTSTPGPQNSQKEGSNGYHRQASHDSRGETLIAVSRNVAYVTTAHQDKLEEGGEGDQDDAGYCMATPIVWEESEEEGNYVIS